MLFQVEATSATAHVHGATAEAPVDDAIRLFWRQFEGDPEGRAYADAIVKGVGDTRDTLDVAIRKASTHWRLERMSRVDRNLLRLGAWERSYSRAVPRAVVLDEAVELAKSYGTEESPAFVNGVLNRIADDLGRADRDR